ncbi:MAG: carboxymuconolactone decarboxylase family protein [bacterium]|nr:MAG: carboxymuconolactone decarboxylase family protein [bacterium]
MTEAGASEKEIKKAISDAVIVRNNAKDIMENHGLQHLGIAKVHGVKKDTHKTSRMTELVSIAAAFAINCTSSLEVHLGIARKQGIAEDEIKTVLDNAHFIKGEAAHYVEEMVKLEKKYDELQELYNQLQNAQAMLVQSEKMAALSKLVATVLHEMNTPIGVIQSNLDVATRSVKTLVNMVNHSKNPEELLKNPRFQKTLDLIQESQVTSSSANERISSIMKSLKSFSRLDEAPFQKIDIHECIENVLTLIEAETRDRITLVRTYSHIPLTPCYPHELTQVFMHILSNAVKAIEKKGEIRIKTYLDNTCIKVEISDTGYGISPRKIAGLFDPDFSQAGSRVKAKLGLFTSFNIMKKHRGDISVESEEGKGSTFTVTFPLNLKEQPEAREIDLAKGNSPRCDKMKN